MAVYCPQGWGTLCQQLTILHILHILAILHILHFLHILHSLHSLHSLYSLHSLHSLHSLRSLRSLHFNKVVTSIPKGRESVSELVTWVDYDRTWVR